MSARFPGLVPLWAPGKEPLPPGLSEEDREGFEKVKKWEGYTSMATESCVFKTGMAGVAGACPGWSFVVTSDPLLNLGFGIGAFFSLMSASFAYEDPHLRAQTAAGRNVTQKASVVFKEMGKGMWTSGKGFGKVGMLFAAYECAVESVSCSAPCRLPILIVLA